GGGLRVVEPQAAGPALACHSGGDVDEQPFLLVWGEPHGRTIGSRRFPGVAGGCRVGFRLCDGRRIGVRVWQSAINTRDLSVTRGGCTVLPAAGRKEGTARANPPRTRPRSPPRDP